MDISNSSPRTLIRGFDFLHRFENELKAYDKFKNIRVDANIGDRGNDFKEVNITCENI